jgi:hypothetical protein
MQKKLKASFLRGPKPAPGAEEGADEADPFADADADASRERAANKWKAMPDQMG